MFGNLIKETCTGTGLVITFTGAVSGFRPYSRKFVTGDVMAYILRDSGGSIVVAGIGIFNGDGTFDRQDTWNDNGTVDKDYPDTNITLSGGTHTVVCDVLSKTLIGLTGYSKQGQTLIENGCLTAEDGGVSQTLPEADNQIALAFRLMETANIATVGISTNVADAASTSAMGLTRLIDGVFEDSYIVSSSIDTTSTGVKTITVNRILEAGWYGIHLVSNSAIVEFRATSSNVAYTWTPLKAVIYSDRLTPSLFLNKTGVINGILDVDPSSITAPMSGNDDGYRFIMERN